MAEARGRGGIVSSRWYPIALVSLCEPLEWFPLSARGIWITDAKLTTCSARAGVRSAKPNRNDLDRVDATCRPARTIWLKEDAAARGRGRSFEFAYTRSWGEQGLRCAGAQCSKNAELEDAELGVRWHTELLARGSVQDRPGTSGAEREEAELQVCVHTERGLDGAESWMHGCLGSSSRDADGSGGGGRGGPPHPSLVLRVTS
ncbi:hypothetical protein DFH09DRAFT_485896 [Mycena vulgaris]|nr:hypothetical protein DFH09DRAFT_485896 [Mycena vulgaris]